MIAQNSWFDKLAVKDVLDAKLIELEIENYYGKSAYQPIDVSGFYWKQCITITSYLKIKKRNYASTHKVQV